MTDKTRRLRRLRNRISRTEQRLKLCHDLEADETRRSAVVAIVRACDRPGREFEDVVDRVVEHLDNAYDPSNPLLEALSDLGFDLVAHAAVTIYRNTQARLRRRLLRDRATLRKLTNKATPRKTPSKDPAG